MKKLFGFIMVGLAFAVLNVATVAAQTAMPGAGDAAAVIPDMSGAAITGSDSVVCDGLSTKRQETNCLRDVLDHSPYAVAKKEGQQRGNYGCGNSDRATHTGCLRDILHQGDNTLAPGTN
jgi:hypothetical protein